MSSTYVELHIVDELGYLSYGPDAANVLFPVVNERHIRRRPILFTTNKSPLTTWGEVLHDHDLAEAIVDRVLEKGRLIVVDGPLSSVHHTGRVTSSLTRGRKQAKIPPEYLENTRHNFWNPHPASTACVAKRSRAAPGANACSVPNYTENPSTLPIIRHAKRVSHRDGSFFCPNSQPFHAVHTDSGVKRPS